MSDTVTVPASEVRAWAREKGLEVGTRGHLSGDVISKFNGAHRRRQFVNNNPNPKREG